MRASSLPLALATAVSLAGAGQAAAQVYDGIDDGLQQPYDGVPYEGDSYDQPAYGEYSYDEPGYDDVTYSELGENEAAYDGEAYDATDAASVDMFRDRMSPYGRWVRTPEYGTVWIPDRNQVGDDFVPYSTRGSWNYSDAGWSFASEYDWGWAAFHYGRWYYDASFGWVWVPGRTWAPAWVDWRFGGGYVGWAPLPPRSRYVDYDDRRTRWCFAPARDIGRRHVQRYVVRHDRRYYDVTSPVRRPHRSGRAVWYAGPRVDHVERIAKKRFHRVRARDIRQDRQRLDRQHPRRVQEQRHEVRQQERRQEARQQERRQEARQQERRQEARRLQEVHQQEQRQQERRQEMRQQERRQEARRQEARLQEARRQEARLQEARLQEVRQQEQRQQERRQEMRQQERRQETRQQERRRQVEHPNDQRQQARRAQPDRDRGRGHGHGRERRRQRN